MIEYAMLALSALLYQFVWLPYYVAKWVTYGYDHMASNRNQDDLDPLPEWGARAQRAQSNYIENFSPFAVAILLLGLSDGFGHYTATAAVLFFLARLGHLIVYTAGLVYTRSTLYTIGLGATLYLYYVLFGVLAGGY